MGLFITMVVYEMSCRREQSFGLNQH